MATEEQQKDWSASHVKEYVDVRFNDRDKLDMQREKRLDDALASSREAIRVAKEEAGERLTAHNGLIQKMEDQGENFVTKDSFEPVKEFQSKLSGGLAVAIVIGITNLVKLWFT